MPIEFNYFTRILPKSSKESLGVHLSVSEMACRCQHPQCCVIIVSTKFIKCFHNLRDLIGRPLYITSGHRCQWHNIEIGGEMLSRHLVGEAADILLPSDLDLKDFMNLAIKAGFTYAKEYQGPSRLHVDCR